jgi:putative ABC transport system permease protein
MDSARTSRSQGPASFRFLTQYAKSLKTPEKVTISSMIGFANAYVEGKRIKLNVKYTDSEFWDVTNFQFVDGKPFNDQHIKNGDRVAVITDALRKQYFEDDGKSVIGKNMEIESINYKVIGVVKGSPVTRVYTYSDIYFPYTAPKSNYQNSGMRGNFVAIVLARKESDFEAIQAEFDRGVSKIPLPVIEFGQKYPVLIVKAEKYLNHFLTALMRDDSTKNRVIFYSIFGFVLLMFMGLPAINLVNVNVSRILERASEIGVRKAFGAPSKALLWQFIIENIFITFIGGMFALALSIVIIYMINSSGWIAYADLTINFTVFIVSILVCLVFGLLSGVLPAYRMSRLKIVEALKA